MDAKQWQNKTPLIGWHVPAEHRGLVDWLNTEAASIGTRGARSEILTAALLMYATANGYDPGAADADSRDLAAAVEVAPARRTRKRPPAAAAPAEDPITAALR